MRVACDNFCMKKTIVLCMMGLMGWSGFAISFTDNFNRANTNGSGTNTLNTIEKNWVGEGARRWDISGNKLVSNSGSGNFIYNIGLRTSNSTNDSSFTQTAYVAVNNSASSAFGGMVVNFDTNTNTGITFRFAGNGTVTFLRPNGTVIMSGTFSETIVPDRAYRMTIFSEAANTYDLEIYDPVADTIVFSAIEVVNGGGSASSDGFGGLYVNTLGVTCDDFSLANSENVVSSATLRLVTIVSQ